MADSESHAENFVVSTELKSLLKEYPALRVDDKRGKVCCCLTGHQMPLRVDAVRSFVQGKRFQKAQTKREHDFEQYKPHLVPNTKRRFEHTLFCTLTLRHITKRPADIERHISGKRYLRALKRWQKCQETGEKFKPRGRLRKQQWSVHGGKASTSEDTKGIWQSGSENEDDSEDDDDLKDLYPSDDFASSDEVEEEEEGDDDNTEDNKREMAAESDDDSDVADDMPQKKTANGQPGPKAVKRKKQQKSGGKKKKR